MSNLIYNYNVVPYTRPVYKHLGKVTLGRCRWLTKPLNWLLNTLQAEELSMECDVDVISLNVADVKHRIIELMNQQTLSGRVPSCVILGRNQYNDLVQYKELAQVLALPDKFLGLKVILHPFIDGTVVI